MEKNLYKFILKYSGPQQVKLLLVIFAGYPVIYIGFTLPKLIINDAIQGGGGPRYLADVELTQFQYLVALCMVFLGVVLINGGVKFWVNVYRGTIGERLLRRLRYDLLNRVLRFPLSTFGKMHQGEVISMVTLEVEKLGKFMGESFSLPAFQGGILVTSLTFLMIENYLMGMAAMALYPLQIYLIPKLQVRVNALEARRIRLVRAMSARIGETMAGAQEIHNHDATQYELADYSSRLGKIFTVRLAIFRRRFFIKFFNNFLAQLGPFFFYLIGGYLVITAQLTIGGLVAMLAAHKEMYAPWKEILNYYQQKEEARVKYQQVIAQFEPAGMVPETHISANQELPQPLRRAIVASGLSYVDENENQVLDSVSLHLDLTKHTVIVGPSGSGAASLTMILSRLLDHTRGTLTYDEMDARQLGESVTGRRIAYAGGGNHVFSGTLGDNLFLGLKHRPLGAPDYGGPERRRRERELVEARLSGNSEYDINADWCDYGSAGIKDSAELIGELARVLKLVELDEEVFELGLRSTIDPALDGGIAEKILDTRIALRERLADPTLSKYVELFDPEKYNSNASLAENLMFGTPVGSEFNLEAIASQEYVRFVLRKAGLEEQMVEMGYRLASLMVELFSNLDVDSRNYQQFNFLDVEDLPRFQVLCSRLEGGASLSTLSEEERTLLMAPTFKLIPTRHRLDLLDSGTQKKILAARAIFQQELPEDLRGAIDFFDPGKYNAAAPLRDNILFGKLAHDAPHAPRAIGDLLRQVIEERGMYEAVIAAGLSTRVGTGGIMLSTPVRSKISLARCLLKKPDILVLYQFLADMEAPERLKILKALIGEFKGRALVFAVKYPSMAEYFDHVLVMRRGEVVERGTFEELNKHGTYYTELLRLEKSQT